MMRLAVLGIKLAKQCLMEFKIGFLLITTFTVLWKFGFLSKAVHDSSSPSKDTSVVNEESVWWKNSPLWVEDQKPHVNPHKFRYVWLFLYPLLYLLLTFNINLFCLIMYSLVNGIYFRYLINEPEMCQKENGNDINTGKMAEVDLLILVASAVSHFDQREAIRATWGSRRNLKHHNTKLLFLLGQGNDQQSLIIDESQMRRDIIQEDFHVSKI